MRLRIFGLTNAGVLVSAVIVGCTGGTDVVRSPELWAADTRDVERRFLPAEWDTAWVRGGADDTLLANPSVLRAAPHGLVVLDRPLHRITAFDPDGRLTWTFGSRGDGPDEFQDPRDVRVDELGRILVYDPGTAKVVVLSHSGQPISRAPLGDLTRGDQFLPISDSAFVLATFAHQTPMAVVDWSGRVRNRFDLPWGDFSALSVVARQGLLFGQATTWGYGFSMGNGWFGYEGLSARPDTGRYVEHTPFPVLVRNSSGSTTVIRMAEPSNCSACSMVLDDGRLYVHFGGTTDLMQRIVDVYSWESGAYLGTVLLPHQAETMDVLGRRFYIGFSDPYPRLVALELRTTLPDR